MSEPNEIFIDTLEYIKQILQLGKEPALELRDYRNIRVLESEIQDLPGIRFISDYEEGSQIWLEVDRLHKSKAPLPDSEKLGSWLNQSHQPTKEPTLKEWVMVSVSYKEAKEMIGKGIASKENVLESPRTAAMFDVRLFSKDDEDLNLEYADYLQKQWLPWAYSEKPRRQTIAIYDKLFTINQLMAIGDVEQPIELVWGIGHAVWEIPELNKTINHPLIETLVEIELDSSTQAVRICPRSVTRERPSIYTAPFENIGIPGVKPFKEYYGKRLDQIESEGKTVHPADPSTFEDILRSAAAQLSTDALYVPDITEDPTNRAVPNADDSMMITDTWAIYARGRGVNYLIRDLERFQEKAKQGEAINSSVAIKFAKNPSDKKPETFKWDLSGRASQLSPGALTGEVSSDQNGVEKNLYFPKPFNDAQREVIERLNESDGVVVQGPPGTGKTHTIANIICHYLATGRRVLVSAKSETALEVLKDQIPKEIQPLVISMVSSDREAMQQQKSAIETLQIKVVGLQGKENLIFKEIKLGEEEVFKLQEDIKTIDKQMEDFAVMQLEPIKTDWMEIDFENAGELARWVVENKGYFEWFPDDLGGEKKYTPLFDDEDIHNLIKAKQVVGYDLQYLDYEIPIVNNLPSLDIVERIHHELITAKDMESTSKKQGIPNFRKESLETIQTAESLTNEVKTVYNWINKNEMGWLKHILHSRVYPEASLPSWMELLNELQPELKLVVEERKRFLRRPVDLILNEATDRALIEGAIIRGKAGKNPLTIFQKINKRAQAVVQSITILGKNPASSEDWNHIGEYLSFKDRCDELRVRWNVIAAETPHLESIDIDDSDFEVIYRKIQEAEQIAYKLTAIIWQGLSEIFPESSRFHRVSPKKDDLLAVNLAINQNLSMYRLSASQKKQKEIIDYINKFSCPEAKILLGIISSKIGSKTDIEIIKQTWLKQINRLQYLRGLANSFDTIHTVTGKIESSGAPNWADSIRHLVFSKEEEMQMREWKEAWRWRRLNSILQSRDIHLQLSQLEEMRLEKENRIKQIFEEVVRHRTYLMLCQTMTDKAKSALSQFMAAIMNVGRGTGVKAPIFLRAAQRAMLQCAEAIPCWIMPSWRVSEVLPAEFDFFDLVVVDEASQCDIRDLPVIARGKKLLIVGDDQQVSPTAPFIEYNKFVQLKYNYLSAQPFGDLMLPGYSLYDLASAVFPGSKIVLNEHFRCVEPIIRFSFQFYPGITISPLRIPKTTERIDPPLVDIFVEGGLKKGDLNYEEADVIVDEIEGLVTNGLFGGRSIGVISLIGKKQAALIQNRLLERIGHEKYLKHKIICGDSATFQGREKDIVFLSMVASPGRSRALTMRQSKQRFNVAASRASDRLYLIRSVGLDHLANPNDLKAKLIHHFNEPMPKRYDMDQKLLDLCESSFERQVFKEMINKGYYVTPQVASGNYRIDLVIEGGHDRRLAIELDGDKYHGPEKWLEDWSRQKVLERMGWRFWRCWASSYIKDPEGCLNSLIQRLEEMGIKPLKKEAKRFVYTEHRNVKSSEDDPEQMATENTEDIEGEEAVEVGDKVILNFDDQSRGSVTIVITKDRTDTDNLIFAKDHDISLSLIGRELNDEVEINIFDSKQKVCIAQIAKGKRKEGIDLEREIALAALSVDGLNSEDKTDAKKTTASISNDQHLIQSNESFPVQQQLGITYPDPLSVNHDTLRHYLNNIIVEYGPIVAEHAYQIYLKRAGIKRLGRQIKRAFNDVVADMLEKGILLNADRDFENNGIIDIVVKTPEQDDYVVRKTFARSVEKIPQNELRALSLEIRQNNPQIGSEELMRAILEAYGLKRLTKKTRGILLKVIEA